MFAILLAAVTLFPSQEKQEPIPGIGPVGEIKKVASKFSFIEGPAADKEGNLYFTDIPANKIHKLDAEGKVSTLIEKSKACNGLMFAPDGRLLACQGGERRIIAIDVATKAITPFVDKYNDKPFNSTNDLVIDKDGGFYFTDPFFDRGGNKLPQDKTAVYYASPQGKATRLIDDIQQPNGIHMSPDEKTLYVLPSSRQGLHAYPIEAPGKVGKGKMLYKCGFGDGMSIDSKGNLYITQPGEKSVVVVSPGGKKLGAIKFPEGPANCTFGGKDRKTLYATARTSLYAAPMEITGHTK